MVGGRVARSGRAQSHVAYYVAMAGIIGLLILLCCYFCYFFISKIRELSHEDSTTTPSSSRPSKEPTSYPIQPVVRDSATAMAALCRQLPAARQQGDQVFPTGRSPDARRTDSGAGPGPDSTGLAPDPTPEKQPAPAATIPCITLEAAR